jgi:hypothetical protein
MPRHQRGKGGFVLLVEELPQELAIRRIGSRPADQPAEMLQQAAELSLGHLAGFPNAVPLFY